MARHQGRPIQQVCEEASEAPGAPPKGTTAHLTNEICHIHAIDQYPAFLKYMSLTVMPKKQECTAFLRQSILDSMSMGYSVRALKRPQALRIRRVREPGVEVAPGFLPSPVLPQKAEINFFPGQKPR